jgi:hypothetical protein
MSSKRPPNSQTSNELFTHHLAWPPHHLHQTRSSPSTKIPGTKAVSRPHGHHLHMRRPVDTMYMVQVKHKRSKLYGSLLKRKSLASSLIPVHDLSNTFTATSNHVVVLPDTTFGKSVDSKNQGHPSTSGFPLAFFNGIEQQSQFLVNLLPPRKDTTPNTS